MAKRIALVVSSESENKLEGTNLDVSRVHSILLNPDLGGCENSKPIHGCNSRSEFVDLFYETIKNWNQEDQLLFYYTGHGAYKRNNSFGLLFGEDFVNFRTINNALDEEAVSKAIIIVDACYSEAAFSGIKSVSDSISRIEEDLPAGRAIISSSRRSQVSEEIQDKRTSVFTRLLCDGIESGLGGKSTKDGLISVGDIVDYINGKLDSEEEYKKYRQRSVHAITGANREIWIAKNKSGPNDDEHLYTSNSQIIAVSSIEELDKLYDRPNKSKHPCIGASFDELDWDLVTSYAQNKGFKEIPDQPTIEFLDKLGFLSFISFGPKNSSQASKRFLHNSAVLCFSIRPEKHFSNATSIFYAELKKKERKEIGGPLIRQLPELLELIGKYVDISGFEIGTDGIRKQNSVEFLLFRELVSNALTHRNYYLNRKISVRISDEYVDIISPGGFPNGYSWKSLLKRTIRASSPVDIEISTYLNYLKGSEGVGRGFGAIKDFINKYGEESVICISEGTEDTEDTIVRVKRNNLVNDLTIVRDSAIFQSNLANLSPSEHQQILQTYVNGVKSLPFDYAARIENFLNEYLGTPSRPVPFGGREKELEILDDWLDNSEQPPYLMLAAPAGRGKSALLAHWSHNIQARGDLEVAFVPVSIRFRTNLSGVFFAALAARLAKSHGEEIKESSTMTVEMWRGLIAEYMQRPLPKDKKLLIIIDGIDEAADWQAGPDIFPSNPPENLKILTSARLQTGDMDAGGWLRRLGWDRNNLGRTLELGLISERDLHSVLESMSFPIAQLSKRVDVAREIFRLSEGDPLLVQLYTVDLWQRGKEAVNLKPEDLQAIEPGLSGYFKRWWTDQESLWREKESSPFEKASTEAVLDLLAFAYGPLFFEDIMYLIGEAYDLNSSRRIEQALIPLSRFVIGDGINQGFMFSHPRLSYYFIDNKTQSERKHWEYRFLEWGMEVVTSLHNEHIDSREVPSYLVQYLGAHFVRSSSDLSHWMLLVHRKWCDAWEAFDGTNAGFLSDVNKAKQIAIKTSKQSIMRGESSSYLHNVIRCTLVESTIRSLNANIPTNLPAQLLKAGIWTDNQSLTFIDQLVDEERKVEILLSSMKLYHKERLGRIIDIARSITSDIERSCTLIGIVPHLSDEMRNEVLNEALQAARLILDTDSRARALADLAPHLSDEMRNEVLNEALQIARLILDTDSRARALADLAPHLSDEIRNEVLDEALHEAREITDQESRLYALADLAPHLSNEELRDVLHQAQSISNLDSRVRVLMGLAPHLNDELSNEVLNKALQAAREITNQESRSYALANLAHHLNNEELRDVLHEVRTISNLGSRALALVDLAPHLSGETRKEAMNEALQTARLIIDTDSRARIMASLAPHLSDEIRNEVLEEALQAARIISDDDSLNFALASLVPYLSNKIRNEVVYEMLQTAREIVDQESRSRVLAGLAPHLSDEMRKEVMKEALHAAREIADQESRSDTLADLAPQLSDEML